MIVIKDMEMPKCCLWECPFCLEDGGACILGVTETSSSTRPKDCPLEEIENSQKFPRKSLGDI